MNITVPRPTPATCGDSRPRELWAFVLPDNEVVMVVVHGGLPMPRTQADIDRLIIDLNRRTVVAQAFSGGCEPGYRAGGDEPNK